ncbi:MAG: hypothetical protein DHS80DRAFT_25116 [Piptocephalis tieghemiana]|nr:MAG: hypothetical protein DHS80DRAFT_25116 [Piptocephalis tieghemiana]
MNSKKEYKERTLDFFMVDTQGKDTQEKKEEEEEKGLEQALADLRLDAKEEKEQEKQEEEEDMGDEPSDQAQKAKKKKKKKKKKKEDNEETEGTAKKGEGQEGKGRVEKEEEKEEEVVVEEVGKKVKQEEVVRLLERVQEAMEAYGKAHEEGSAYLGSYVNILGQRVATEDLSVESRRRYGLGEEGYRRLLGKQTREMEGAMKGFWGAYEEMERVMEERMRPLLLEEGIRGGGCVDGDAVVGIGVEEALEWRDEIVEGYVEEWKELSQLLEEGKEEGRGEVRRMERVLGRWNEQARVRLSEEQEMVERLTLLERHTKLKASRAMLDSMSGGRMDLRRLMSKSSKEKKKKKG